MISILGLVISGCALALALANGCTCNANRGLAGAGGVPVTGGTGGMPVSGGSTATGGQRACSPTELCAAGKCVGASCGDIWTCLEDGRPCATSLADYCGCDGITFQDSQNCPKRPYVSRGACGQGTNCDPRDVGCDTMPPTCGQGQVPRVVGTCYDGTCVPIERCLCTVAEECPDPRSYTCLMGGIQHCSPWLR